MNETLCIFTMTSLIWQSVQTELRNLITMTGKYTYHSIPTSRIATFDVYAVGLQRHHVSALLEFDVTTSRKKLRELKRRGRKVTFSAWLIKVISRAVQQHPEAAAYLYSKKKLITFDDINISILIEKEIDGKRVPIPLVIERTNEKSIEEIALEIEKAGRQIISDKDIVLNKPSKMYENLYYHLPGFLRRMIWRWMLRRPRMVHRKMGNVVITSLGMIGKINGWFIHQTVHPLSVGTGSIIKKPRVSDDRIEAREILNMTVLMDHDVLDGAPMVRFINDLTRYIENGSELSSE